MEYSVDRQNLQQAIGRLDNSAKPDRDDLASLQGASMSWDLDAGFEQSREMAEAGWSEKAAALWRQVQSLALKIDNGVKDHFDVTGESVDVGRFLSGEPECMAAQIISPLAAVPVMLNISARCDADARLIFNRGIAVAAVIHALQGSGRSVSLTVCENVSRGDSQHETFITMQEFGEYINPGRLAFWAAHPGALRRCIFRYNEQQSDDVRNRLSFYEGGGYGRPGDVDVKKLPPGTVYISFPETNDLENRFGSPERALVEVVKEFRAKGVPIEISGVVVESD